MGPSTHVIVTAMNQLQRSKVACRYSRGFTLIELAVVIFMIGLIMMIAMPHLSVFGDEQLKSQTRRIASYTNYLYQEAGTQKVVLKLTWDLDHDRYFVTRLDPFAIQPVFQPEQGPGGKPVVMPDTVTIRDVTVEGAGTFKRGTVSTQFYPGGSVDATLVHLTDTNGVVFTLGIEPFSGHVTVQRGDINPPGASRFSR
jgi:general secretion pathway protein H